MRKTSRDGGILMSLLTGAAIILCIIVLGGMYIATHVRVGESHSSTGHTVRVESPFGAMNVREQRKFDPETLGVPVYPGAVRESNGSPGASLEFELPDSDRSVSFVFAEYRTEDSAERVAAFYRGKLPHWIVTTKRDGSSHMEYRKGGYKRFVSIREEGDGTHVGLASVGEPAGN